MLFRLITRRYEQGSIRIIPNTSGRDWTELRGVHEALAIAILDRRLHKSLVKPVDLTDSTYLFPARLRTIGTTVGASTTVPTSVSRASKS